MSIGGCKPIGELCSSDDVCCTKNCEDNDGDGVTLCGQPPNCRPPGEICDPSFGECCPGVPQGKLLCLPGAYGVTRCQEPCCEFTGEACQVDDDCCSGKCNVMTMTCDQGFACKVIGEMCQTGDECCSKSCTGGVCDDCPCIPSGDECVSPRDCCGGDCVPDPVTGKLTCDPGMGQGGAGGMGQGGNGGSGGCELEPDGAPCFSNAECCSGLCGGGEFPECQPSPCKSLGAMCVQGECCSMLTCTNGVCVL
jgi:hypothetical protein